ncbi:MAG: glycosyl transferase [Methylotenera sp.]|nr:MAG: glycosyl transferase [Methylotenera sp.]
MNSVSVALIEPVGSHGGMDYYDSGLSGGLVSQGVPVAWYTCDSSVPCGNIPFEMKHTFVGIWGKDSAWLRGLRYVRGLFASLSDSRSRGANVAHFHFFHIGPLEFLGVLLSRLYGLKVVATIHDVESFKPGLTSTKLRSITYNLCSRLIVHNRVSCEELVSRCDVAKEVVRIIPHGSYLGLVSPAIARDKARTMLGLPLDSKVILFFGQIKEVKGLDVLIEAVGKNLKELEPVTLVIAGKVWKDSFSKYQVLIDQHNINNICSLHIRYIPDDELSAFYSAADIIVLPYHRIYQSGVLLMAMSFGVPVLASDLLGMREIVTDGENGFLFPAGDAEDLGKVLIRVLNDKKLLDKVAEKARIDMLTKFGWGEIAHKTIQVYKEVIQ